jgi:hypothetical protein
MTLLWMKLNTEEIRGLNDSSERFAERARGYDVFWFRWTNEVRMTEIIAFAILIVTEQFGRPDSVDCSPADVRKALPFSDGSR